MGKGVKMKKNGLLKYGQNLIACLVFLCFLMLPISSFGATRHEEIGVELKTMINNHGVADHSYSAGTPEITAMWDSNNNYHIAYRYDNYSEAGIYIQRYDENINLIGTVKISGELPLYGNFITDGEYYYVVWGNDVYDSLTDIAINVSKYSFDGKKISSIGFTGPENNPFHNRPAHEGDYWGTQTPFRSGNCALFVKNNILVCNYARKMYSGHQSNCVLYLDTRTMTRLNDNYAVYCSHSFNQDVIITSEGGYLFANQGDAYSRGFMIDKVTSNRNRGFSDVIFHFREGAKRDYGYNETYAEMGGAHRNKRCLFFLRKFGEDAFFR